MNMLATITSSAVCTMSSREIAELTGKRHDHVMRDIRAMLVELHGDDVIPSFGAIYHDAYGREKPCFDLPKRETLILVSGYSVSMRAKIIDRWQELEAAVAQPAPTFKLPTTFSEALRLAAEQAEKIESQALQLQHQQPAVEFVDRYTVATGLKGVREVCKILKANERQFVDWMTESGIMYRLAGRLTPYQPHIDAGRFLVKTGLSGDGHAFSSPKFTAKGVSWVAGEWGKFQVSGRG